MSATARRIFGASRWNVLVAVTAAAVLWLALWVFSEMMDDTPKGEFAAWDEPTIRRVREESSESPEAALITRLALGITQLGSSAGLAIVVIGGLAWALTQGRWPAAVILVAAAAGAALAIALLKHHFMRLRPTAVEHLVTEDTWSFPSGHSLASAAVYLTLSVVLAQQVTSRKGQVALIAGAFLLSFLIGVSRIYLGVHYPTDVLAGWSAGTAWAIVCSAALVWWERASPRPAND